MTSKIQSLYDTEAEAGLLGAILDGYEDSEELLHLAVSRGLRGESFYSETYATIFEQMLMLHRKGQPVDAGALLLAFRDSGEFDQVGGAEAFFELQERAFSSLSAREALQSILNYAGLRRTKRALRLHLEKIHEPGAKKGAILAELEMTIRDLAESVDEETDFVSMGEIAADRIESLQAKLNGEGVAVITAPTQLPLLNSKLANGGFSSGDLIVLAARPSVGKTAIAMNFVEQVSQQTDYHSLIFSLEMDAGKLGERTASGLSRVSAKAISDAALSKAQLESVNVAYRSMHDMRVSVVKSKRISILDIRSKALIFKAKVEREGQQLGLVLVDYLQLVQPIDRRMPREQQVAEISRELKLLAGELSVPILLLAQINRESEKTGREPRASDLRESGAIEQDADLVLLLHRLEEDRGLLADPTMEVVKLIIDKNRHGARGDFVMLDCHKPTMRFTQRSVGA